MMNELSEPKNGVPEAASLVEVRRGGITESRHRGHIAVVDGDGQLVASLGATHTVTYSRSAAKPQQAFPLVAAGAAERFDFNDQEIAIACGSHNGEPQHTATVARMLRKMKLDESMLKCGAHEPYDPQTARELKERGERPSALHNNCSGNHAGIIALALHLSAPAETYEQPGNPAQLAIAQAIAQFSGVPVEDIAVGIDGCGIPAFGVTMRAMALMCARLVVPPESWEPAERAACARIVGAMRRNPEMIGGVRESLDTALMKLTNGRLLAKAGAEGIFTAAILPSEQWPCGLGIALKIEDGDAAKRARRPTAIEMLRQLGALTDDEIAELEEYARPLIRNHRGETVGEARAAFELQPGA